MKGMPENVSNFYKNTAIKLFELKDKIVDTIKNPFVIYIASNKEFISDIEVFLVQLQKLKKEIKPLKRIDPKIYSYFTPKMKKAYITARSFTKEQRIITEALNKAKGDPRLQEIVEILNRKDIPDKLKQYLVQSSILYFLGLYESSITMIGKATEFTLKEFFKKNQIKYNDNETLGQLITIYENTFGNDKVQKHIMEVDRVDRNISSHDSNQKITKKDADHMRTAIMVLLRDLLNMDITLRIES